MPWTAFVDKKVFEELEKIETSNKKSIFPEHDFLTACLRIGLKIEDLKILTYIDVLKIFITIFNNNEKEEKTGTRIATKKDIEKMVAMM